MGNRLEVSAHKKNRLMTRIVGKSSCLDPGRFDSEMLVFFIMFRIYVVVDQTGRQAGPIGSNCL